MSTAAEDQPQLRETPTSDSAHEKARVFLNAGTPIERVLDFERDLLLPDGQYDHVNCLVYTANGKIVFRWDSASLARDDLDQSAVASVLDRYWEATAEPVYIRQRFFSDPRERPFEVLAVFRVRSAQLGSTWNVAPLLDGPRIETTLISAIFVLLGECMADYEARVGQLHIPALRQEGKEKLRFEVQLADVGCTDDVRLLSEAELAECLEAAVLGQISSTTKTGEMLPTYYIEDSGAATRLDTLPTDLMVMIRDYFDPYHETERFELGMRPRRDFVRVAKAMSLVCKRLQRFWQPIVFRHIRLIGGREVDRVFETLNGESGMWVIGPKPGDPPIIKDLWDKGAAPIVDIQPSRKDDFLRSAVRAVSIWNVHGPREEAPSASIMDLRFILQVMPNLRFLWLHDMGGQRVRWSEDIHREYIPVDRSFNDGYHHILDKTSRVLRKFHDLEHFGYANGHDLMDFGTRNPVFRSIGNMPRLRSLAIADCTVGRNPWILPEDIGADGLPMSLYETLFGPAFHNIWWRPYLMIPEAPPDPCLPRQLRTLSLRRVSFTEPDEDCEQPPRSMMEMMRVYSPLVRDDRPEKEDSGFAGESEENHKGKEKKGLKAQHDDKPWTEWPPDFHPFCRLLTCSKNSLTTLRLVDIRGVSGDIFSHAMSLVGPHLIELEWCERQHSMRELLHCTSLQIVTLDRIDEAHFPDQVARFREYFMPTLRRFNVRRHWRVQDLCDWIESGHHPCKDLQYLSISTWTGYIVDTRDESIHDGLLRRLWDACVAKGISLELPEDYQVRPPEAASGEDGNQNDDDTGNINGGEAGGENGEDDVEAGEDGGEDGEEGSEDGAEGGDGQEDGDGGEE